MEPVTSNDNSFKAWRKIAKIRGKALFSGQGRFSPSPQLPKKFP